MEAGTPAPDNITLHGTLLEVEGIGVLIEGAAGIGKSALALELVSRGHRLVADDTPEFHCCDPTTIVGRCPPPLQDFIEVFGLGVLNIPAMFGPESTKRQCQLDLIVSLTMAERLARDQNRPLQALVERRTILGVSIPAWTLPLSPALPRALMVESVVRLHKLRMAGYDAAKELQAIHSRAMDQKP